MEPCNLKRCKITDSENKSTYFYTCGRPGRSKGREGCVSDDLVSEWVLGIQKILDTDNIMIISLLGRKYKKTGQSEFSFYSSFYGPWDNPKKREDKVSFQEWLDEQHGDIRIVIREHPTIDHNSSEPMPLADIKRDIHNGISEGRTVIVIDSAGETRTGKVRDYMKTEDEKPLTAPCP